MAFGGLLVRRWLVAALLGFSALSLAGCEEDQASKRPPDPRPTGLGVKWFRPVPAEGDAGGDSAPAAEEDAAAAKSFHPLA
ncbi:MAG TPA: hypothetical protein VGE52_01615 [Pirellulales bacterium]